MSTPFFFPTPTRAVGEEDSERRWSTEGLQWSKKGDRKFLEELRRWVLQCEWEDVERIFEGLRTLFFKRYDVH